MKSLMDDVDYHFGAGGTEVILRKRIKAAGSPQAEEEMKS
jgi:hypothetical protein